MPDRLVRLTDPPWSSARDARRKRTAHMRLRNRRSYRGPHVQRMTAAMSCTSSKADSRQESSETPMELMCAASFRAQVWFVAGSVQSFQEDGDYAWYYVSSAALRSSFRRWRLGKLPAFSPPVSISWHATVGRATIRRLGNISSQCDNGYKPAWPASSNVRPCCLRSQRLATRCRSYRVPVGVLGTGERFRKLHALIHPGSNYST